MVPEVIGYPVRGLAAFESIELRVLELLIQKLSLPDGMPVVLDVIDQ